jgi:hypothetical protein
LPAALCVLSQLLQIAAFNVLRSLFVSRRVWRSMHHHSQYKGVSYHKGTSKWIAQTKHRSKKVYAAFETEDLLAVGVLGTRIATVSHAVALRL